MILTAENYYSPEANRAYWSASFVKDMMKCPARAIAELNGEYQRPENKALLIGSYVDSHFEGTLDSFVAQHPEVFKKDGTLKSEFILAEQMINRAESDRVFMDYMRGKKQTIFTGTIGGIPFKCKMDVFLPGKRIVDLKTTKDMESKYIPEQGKVNFAEYWNWPLQLAIYQVLEGNELPCFLAVITKEDPPDIGVFEIPQHVLDTEIEILLSKLPYFDAMREGIVEAERCEHCDYCRSTRKLFGPVSIDSLTEF